jgi:OFA family oxalate/formate antiporter-like MFS transporter
VSGWKAVVLLIPFQFMFGLIYAWGAMAPSIHLATGWSASTLDLMFSLTPLVLLPAVLIGGHLVGRVGPRRVLQVATGSFVVGGLLALSGNSPQLFAAGYAGIALGIGGGLSTPACVALIHNIAPRRQGRLAGTLLAVYGLSGAVSGPLFLWLAHHAPWHTALAAVMGTYAVIAGLCLTRVRSGVNANGAARSERPLGHEPISLWQPILNIALLCATVPFGSAVFAAIGRLATEHGHTASLGVAGASIMSLANGAGRFAGGVLSDLISIPVAWCLILGLAVGGYIMALADARLGSPALFLLFAASTGLSFGALAGKLPAVAAHTSPSNPASMFSFYFGTFAFGSFGGPFLSAELGLPITMTVLGWATVIAFVLCTAQVLSSRRSAIPY